MLQGIVIVALIYSVLILIFGFIFRVIKPFRKLVIRNRFLRWLVEIVGIGLFMFGAGLLGTSYLYEETYSLIGVIGGILIALIGVFAGAIAVLSDENKTAANK